MKDKLEEIYQHTIPHSAFLSKSSIDSCMYQSYMLGKQENIENYKLEADQAERQGDYGKVAELRYGKIKEAEENLEKLKKQVASLQGENAMLKEEVVADDIAEIVARRTGIPVSKMLQGEREKLLTLETELIGRAHV